MNCKYSKKQLEELYHCNISKDNGFDDSHLFYIAYGICLSDKEESLFDYADGWTLDELHENIRDSIFDTLISISSDVEENKYATQLSKIKSAIGDAITECLDKAELAGFLIEYFNLDKEYYKKLDEWIKP